MGDFSCERFGFELSCFWLPGWMDVTRAPVESQAAWKPKSRLLLGFWFRLIRISQKSSWKSHNSRRVIRIWTTFQMLSIVLIWPEKLLKQ